MDYMLMQIWIILGVMVVVFALAKWKLTVEISLVAAAIGGALTGALFATPPLSRIPYHLVNGALVYLDIVLIFIMATFLMEVVRVSGGAEWVVRNIVRKFGGNRALTLIMLMVVMLIPGALSGVGTTSLVIVGAPVASVLKKLGVPKLRVTGMLFILASLGAVAPPVNLWAMIACAGAAIPYVGFELPLVLPVLFLGGFTLLVFGRGTRALDTDATSMEMIPKEEEEKGMTGWRVLAPFVVLILLMVAYRVWPFYMPVLGLPLQFAIAAVVGWLLSKKRLNMLVLMRDSIERVLPLIGTIIAVGILQEIMAATGVRGLISFSFVIIPMSVLLLSLPLTMPLMGGLLAFGVAGVVGIPLMWYFQFRALNLIVALSGLTLLWALGTALPPTAIIGRFSILVTKYEGTYVQFLKGMWIPWIAITVVGTLMVVFSTKLGFLFG